MSSFFQKILEIPTTNLLMGGAAIIGGFFLSTVIVSYVNYDKKAKYNPEMSIDEEYKEEEYKREAREVRQKKIQYGQKFFDELEALEDRVLTNEELVGLRELHIEEDTPEGKVIMLYNSNTESFWFYSDTKNISNRTLDAIARKYAITHNCKQICVNHKKEIAAVQKKICDMIYSTRPLAAKEEPASTSNEDVFVKTKVTPKKLIKRHRRVIVDRVNRFTYKGKQLDCKLKNVDTKEPKEKDHSNLTFQEFKKLSLEKKKNE